MTVKTYQDLRVSLSSNVTRSHFSLCSPRAQHHPCRAPRLSLNEYEKGLILSQREKEPHYLPRLLFSAKNNEGVGTSYELR